MSDQCAVNACFNEQLQLLRERQEKKELKESFKVLSVSEAKLQVSAIYKKVTYVCKHCI